LGGGGTRRCFPRLAVRRRRQGERYFKVDVLTVLEVGKNGGKSADCERRISMGCASVKRIVFIVFIFYFFFFIFMFAILLFLSGTEYVSLFVPARSVYNRTRLSVFVALQVPSLILCSFTQLTRGPSTSQNLLSCSILTHSLTHTHARTHTQQSHTFIIILIIIVIIVLVLRCFIVAKTDTTIYLFSYYYYYYYSIIGY